MDFRGKLEGQSLVVVLAVSEGIQVVTVIVTQISVVVILLHFRVCYEELQELEVVGLVLNRLPNLAPQFIGHVVLGAAEVEGVVFVFHSKGLHHDPIACRDLHVVESYFALKHVLVVEHLVLFLERRDFDQDRDEHDSVQDRHLQQPLVHIEVRVGELSDLVPVVFLLLLEVEVLEDLRKHFLLVDFEVEEKLFEELFVLVRLGVLYLGEKFEDQVRPLQNAARQQVNHKGDCEDADCPQGGD